MTAETLAELDIGDKAKIIQITGVSARAEDGYIGQAELEHRLLEAGFMEGEIIEVIHHGPVSHDPMAVQIDDMIVALRRNEAKSIHIEKIS